VDSIRELGVYDNTVFIVVADHGNNIDDHDIILPGTLDNPLDRANLSRASVLLMGKFLGSVGPFARDERLMSNADAVGLLDTLSDEAEVKTLNNPVQRNAVAHYRLLGTWREFLQTAGWSFERYEVFRQGTHAITVRKE
jgi:arylsulfatase A-like enzyme